MAKDTLGDNYISKGVSKCVYTTQRKNKNKDLFIVDFSKLVNISARAIFWHEMMVCTDENEFIHWAMIQ